MPVSVDAFPFFGTTPLRHNSWIEGVGEVSDLTPYGYTSSWRALAYKSIDTVSGVLPQSWRATIATSMSPWLAYYEWTFSVAVSNGTEWTDLGSSSYYGDNLTHDYIVEPTYDNLPAGWPDGFYWFPVFIFRDMCWSEGHDWPAPTAFDGLWTSESLGQVEVERNRLYRFTGREVISTYTPPPPPPYTPPPPVPTSPSSPPSRPSPPRTPAIPTRPSNPPGPVSGWTNRTMVPCPDVSDGRARFSVWETDDNGNLLRRISPCQ